ncbi:hypothetical protein FRC01_000711 [Tulasnella sp. 417]|nr:hypothetical protein FRC01_000711 [Tulasnella sp. 417]
MSFAYDSGQGTFRDVQRADLGDYANTLGAKIIQKLWDDWGKDEEGIRNGEVDLYNGCRSAGVASETFLGPVNIPIVNELRQPGGLEVLWTRVWRNSYGQVHLLRRIHRLDVNSDLIVLDQLFKRKEDEKKAEVVREAGPDAPPESSTLIKTSPSDSKPTETSSALVFRFAPQIDALVNPPLESLPHGSDGWAMHYRKASVTPLRASFAEPLLESLCLATERGAEGLGPGREFKV